MHWDFMPSDRLNTAKCLWDHKHPPSAPRYICTEGPPPTPQTPECKSTQGEVVDEVVLDWVGVVCLWAPSINPNSESQKGHHSHVGAIAVQ